MPSRPTVTLYERPDCHLCDEALAGARGDARPPGRAFELERSTSTRDDELLRRHLERIPVVELDGEEVSELGLDADALRARLATVSA